MLDLEPKCCFVVIRRRASHIPSSCSPALHATATARRGRALGLASRPVRRPSSLPHLGLENPFPTMAKLRARTARKNEFYMIGASYYAHPCDIV